MSYITHQQLAERPGARELAEVASDMHQPMVPYYLMELTLLGDDRTAFDADEIVLADEALQRIDDAIADAEGLIDGYLRQRGYPLPLDPVHRLVTVWCRAITRYNVHNNRSALASDDPITRDYRDALKMLQQVADGKLSLGADDDLGGAGPSGGAPLVCKGATPVRDALDDY